MRTVFEDLQWRKFECLDDGFVCLVDAMPRENFDAAVVQAARISYGKDQRCEEAELKAAHAIQVTPGMTTKDLLAASGKATDAIQKDDEKLIRYLMSHRHTTPFEMVEFKFLVRCPMDCWRQWIRHRTANVNEYSTRYAEAIDSMATTDSKMWRLQSQTNKQGSGDFLPEHIEGTAVDGAELSALEEHFHNDAIRVYKYRLSAGIAKEQARKDLPLSTYTEAYWKIDLHNLLHFLGLRCDPHAQIEIRTYANAMAEIVRMLMPATWRAYEDFRMEAVTLSHPEQKVLYGLRFSLNNRAAFDTMLSTLSESVLGKREKEAFIGKLVRMGLLPEKVKE